MILLLEMLENAVSVHCSHWLIIKAVWPMTRPDKVRRNSQTENSDEIGVGMV